MRDEEHGVFRIIAVLLVVIATGAGLWGAFSLFWPQDDGQIAMLRADSTPIKVKPDEPGGMVIPHQDKQVFNAVSSDGKMVTVERILPGPEKPVIPQTANVINEAAALTQAQVAAAQAASPAASGQSEPSPSPVAMGRAVDAPAPLPAPRQAAAVVAPAPVATIPNLAVDPAALAKAGAKAAEKPVEAAAAFDGTKMDAPLPAVKAPAPAVEKAIEKTIEKPATGRNTKAQPKTEEELAAMGEEQGGASDETGEDKNAAQGAAPLNDKQEAAAQDGASEMPDDNAKGSARFQLASFFDRPSAEKAKAKFSGSYAAALKGSALQIVEASIPGKGKVYRIQGSAADAASVCSQVKAQGGTCVITRQ